MTVMIDQSRLLLFTGGTVPAAGASAGDLGAEIAARQAGDEALADEVAGRATAAQGAKADSAVQPAALAAEVAAREAAVATAKDRSTHTGVQPIATVNELPAALSGLSQARIDGDAEVVAGFAPVLPFESTRGDIVAVILDADGREVTARPEGYRYEAAIQQADFETTRTDLGALSLDADGRMIRPGDEFETTRVDLDLMEIDPSGRQIRAIGGGFRDQPITHGVLETTRGDLDLIMLDSDGRQIGAVAPLARLGEFETTRAIPHIRLDAAGREIKDGAGSEVTPAQLQAVADDLTALSQRVSVSLDAQGAIRQPDYGAWAMREFRMRSRRLLRGDAVSLVMAFIGDSWTQMGPRYVSPLTEALWAAYGFGGVGYQGFGWFGPAGGPWVIGGAQPVGSDSGVSHGNPWAQTRYSGAWSCAYNTAATHMPSISAITSSTPGALLQLVVSKEGHNKAVLHYIGVDDAEIEISWDNGTTWENPITLTGIGAQYLELPGVPTGEINARLRVISGTVSLGGIDWQKATGLRVHKLGGSGSQAAHWASVGPSWADGVEALGVDCVAIVHGTNDQTGSRPPATFGAYVQTIANNVLGVRPACDILLVTPAENNRTTNAVAMAAYAAVERQIAITHHWAHLDLQEHFGPADNYGAAYAASNAARPWMAADLIHPEPTYPVIVDAIARFLAK